MYKETELERIGWSVVEWWIGLIEKQTDDFIYCYNYSINYINTIEDHILHRIITTIASMLALYVDLHYR